jgi:hypothetical protein
MSNFLEIGASSECRWIPGQSYFDFGMRAGTALKGHGFSRALTHIGLTEDNFARDSFS